MALFTSKADADLPLLTQFYQLEFDPRVPEKSELDRWMGRVCRPPRSFWTELTLPELMERVKDPSCVRDLEPLRGLAQIHSVIRRVMDCLADGISSTFEDQEELHKWASAAPSPYQSQVLRWNSKNGRHQFNRTGPGWVDLLMREMIKAVDHEAGGGARWFGRCEECKNAFLGKKESQRFCSHRCGDRVSARRKRKGLSD
jgi:hypothetical protein